MFGKSSLYNEPLFVGVVPRRVGGRCDCVTQESDCGRGARGNFPWPLSLSAANLPIIILRCV